MKRSTRASAAAAAAAAAVVSTPAPSKTTTPTKPTSTIKKTEQPTSTTKPKTTTKSAKPPVVYEHSPIATKTRSAVKARLAKKPVSPTPTPTKASEKTPEKDSIKSKTKKLVNDLLNEIPSPVAPKQPVEEPVVASEAAEKPKKTVEKTKKSVVIVENEEVKSKSKAKPIEKTKTSTKKPTSEVKKPVSDKKPTKDSKKSKRNPALSSKKNVLYIGHVPEGFHEYEMLAFLGQFGEVLQARVARSKRTGKSKGYAFVQFEDEQVSEIVRKTLHGYILLGRTLVCKTVPEEDVHENMFLKALTKKFVAQHPQRTTVNPLVSRIRDPRLVFVKRHNRAMVKDSARQIKTDETREKRLQNADRLKRVKLTEKKIDYTYDGY